MNRTGRVWYCYGVELPDFAGNFWAGVGIAAAVATALATGVSTFLAALWRWRDRPEAEWKHQTQDLGGVTAYHTPGNAPQVTVELTNIGDGDAYKVVFEGSLLEAIPIVGRRSPTGEWADVTQPVAVLRTGESVSVIVKAETSYAWETASFTISWWHAPTRRRRKWLGLKSTQLHAKFNLRDLGNNPAEQCIE